MYSIEDQHMDLHILIKTVTLDPVITAKDSLTIHKLLDRST